MKNIVYLQTLKVNLQFKLMKYCMPNILFGFFFFFKKVIWMY